MEREELIQTIRDTLPVLLQEEPTLKDWVLKLTRGQYADREQTESRFDLLLEELRLDREENKRKWDEQNRKWDEQNRKWDEQNQQNKALLLEIKDQESKLNRKIGGLGARWGIGSESAFRSALAGVLTKSFDVEVLNVNEYDDEGEVFGRPDQVELDIIIRNGSLLIFELKSSADRSHLHIFNRKIAFYERRHQRKADRKILISPFIHPRAAELAPELGIEIYGDSTEVPL